jgi:hypothetical protein
MDWKRQRKLERQAEQMSRARILREIAEEGQGTSIGRWWYECGRCGLKLEMKGEAEESARQKCLVECGAEVRAEVALVGREEWRRQALGRSSDLTLSPPSPRISSHAPGLAG